LERAEGMANAASVDSRRDSSPESGATWIEVAGVYAMFDDPSSPITQTFGLGLFDPFQGPEFDRVERFFAERGAATAHEVSSFAAPETLSLLGARDYSPIEASTVLVRPTSNPPASRSEAIAVRAVDHSELPVWCRISAQGWSSEAPELGPRLEKLGGVMARARGVTCFLAEKDGEPIATGALNIANGVALLAGATTIPAARRQGAQLELLHTRLALAAARGIELAMVVTLPGSASQRNAERQGFRPVYTRAKWQRAST
ncbi:MAG: GNAT family N-acetyltransferase, partial [bacterium]